MQTLVLDPSYRPIKVVDWQKAVYLILTEKADMLIAHDRVIRSVSMTIQLPKVVVIRTNAKIKLKKKTGFQKQAVFNRDGWLCQYCGTDVDSDNATIDHVMPSSRGGLTSYENIVTACQPCNFKKANRTPLEARMQLKSMPERPKDNLIYDNKLQSLYEDFLAVWSKV